MIIHTALANHAAYGACNNFEEAVGKVFTIFSSNLCCPLFPLFLHPPYGICSLPQFTTNRAQTGSHNDSKGLWRLRFASTSRRLDVMGQGAHVVSRQCLYSINLFLGKLNQFFFDPTWWWWHEVIPFLAYLAKLGRKWKITQEALKKSIPNIQQNEIPCSTSPRWHIIWHKHKTQKKVANLQSIIHKVVAMNKWHG